MNQTNETTNAAFDKGMRAGTGAKMRVKKDCFHRPYGGSERCSYASQVSASLYAAIYVL